MYLGIDVGGTTVKAGLIDNNGELTWSDSRPTRAEDGKEASVEAIVNFLEEILAARADIKSIGVGVPGIVGAGGIVRVAPNLPGWLDVPLGEMLRGKTGIRIAVENDANAAAVAELLGGAGVGVKNFIYATLGTGVGGGIIIDGKLYTGATGGAGEIGHMIIDHLDAPVSDERGYRAGVVEEKTGRAQIIKLAKKIAAKRRDSALNGVEDLDVLNISEAIYEGDWAAIETFKLVGYYLGLAFASAMNLLDIHYLIIGGGISQAHPMLFDCIADTIKKRALPHIAKDFELKPAKFLQETGIYGAAFLGKLEMEA
ncbi:MAG: ROK family protein [Chloroflexota bacterium]